MQQALFAVAALLLLPVVRYGSRVFLAISPPIVRVFGAPFARAVQTNLAINFVACQPLLARVTAPLLLTLRLTANALLRLILRWLEGFLTVAAAPFAHTGRYRIDCPLMI